MVLQKNSPGLPSLLIDAKIHRVQLSATSQRHGESKYLDLIDKDCIDIAARSFAGNADERKIAKD